MIPNHRRSPVPLVLLFLTALPLSAPAQQVLTREQVLARALERSIDVEEARRRLEGRGPSPRDAGVVSPRERRSDLVAEGSYLIHPQVERLFVAPGTLTNAGPDMEAYPIGGRHTALVGLRFSLELLRAAGARAAAGSGGGAGEVAKAELDLARALVRQEAELAWYRALRAREEMRLFETHATVADSSLRVVRARFAAGRAMPVDTVVAGAGALAARSDAERAGFAYRRSLVDLALLLDIEDYASIEPVGELEFVEVSGPTGGDVAGSGPGVAAASRRLLQARAAAAGEEGVPVPQAQAQAQAQGPGPSLRLVGGVRALGAAPGWSPDAWRVAMESHVGLAARFRVSDLWEDRQEGRAPDPREPERLAAAERARVELRRREREERGEVERLRLRVDEARAGVRAAESAIAAAEAQLAVTRILQNEGRAGWSQVEDAQDRLVRARLQRLGARYALVEARVLLRGLGSKE